MSFFKDHFSGVANRYADFRPNYPAPLFDYLATLVPADATVWDCAAGNGQASLGLAALFKNVIATDASAEQIASGQPHARIEYRVASAEQSGLPGQSIGLITVAQALHWFDLPKFWAEAKRVLTPRGVIAVWSYGINRIEGEAVNDIALDYYENVVGPYWPPERVLVADGYRSIPFPFAELSPPPFHMETNWTLGQLLGYYSTWSATNRYIKANGKNPLDPLASALTRVWGHPERPRRVLWPLSLRAGRLEN